MGIVTHTIVPNLMNCRVWCHGPKPYESIGFGDTHGPKPYKSIGFGDMSLSFGLVVVRHVPRGQPHLGPRQTGQAPGDTRTGLESPGTGPPGPATWDRPLGHQK